MSEQKPPAAPRPRPTLTMAELVEAALRASQPAASPRVPQTPGGHGLVVNPPSMIRPSEMRQASGPQGSVMLPLPATGLLRLVDVPGSETAPALPPATGLASLVELPGAAPTPTPETGSGLAALVALPGEAPEPAAPEPEPLVSAEPAPEAAPVPSAPAADVATDSEAAAAEATPEPVAPIAEPPAAETPPAEAPAEAPPAEAPPDEAAPAEAEASGPVLAENMTPQAAAPDDQQAEPVAAEPGVTTEAPGEPAEPAMAPETADEEPGEADEKPPAEATPAATPMPVADVVVVAGLGAEGLAALAAAAAASISTRHAEIAEAAAAVDQAAPPAAAPPVAAPREPEAAAEAPPPALYEPVLRGRDMMLFSREGAAVEQVCGMPPEDADLARLAIAHESRFAWCALRDIRHFVLVVPDKLAICEEQLPDGMAPCPDRAALALRYFLAPRFMPFFLYPLDRLRERRAERETVLRTDPGWSPFGAFLGYRALTEAMVPYLPIEPLDESVLEILPQRFTGELGALLDPPPVETYAGLLTRRVMPVRVIPLNPGSAGHVPVRIFENDNRGLPSLVMFHSPASEPLIGPFLAAHFSRIVAVADPGGFYPELVLSELPDVVVTELPECRLAPPALDGGIRLPEEMTVPDFAARTGLTLPLPFNRRD